MYMKYQLKAGTLNDIEDIWQIIEKAWLQGQIDESEKDKLILRLHITHSIEKIRMEILNREQHYIMLIENECSVAFASYSFNHRYPADFSIHQLYNLPSAESKKYIQMLISHIEILALQQGSKHLMIQTAKKEQSKYFESLGFYSSQLMPSSAIYPAIHMLKNIR